MNERGQNTYRHPVLPMLLLLHLTAYVSSSSLYGIDDPLWELDINNFQRIVLNKNTAWIMEFYSSWCGHCIRFAPHWKEFARDIENWKNVIEVGVVNCADSENTPLCRNYDVAAYPTIKLFPSMADSGEKGQKIEGSRELDFLRHSIIDFITTNANKTIPSQWPNLNETKSTSLNELWGEIPSSVTSLYVIVENPRSYVGREVILDFSIDKHILVRRALNTNSQLLNELIPGYQNTTLVLVRVNRDGTKDILYTSPAGSSSQEIRDQVFETVIGWNRVRKPSDVTTVGPDTELTSYDGVYMVDLENAVRYALYQEVSVHELISGEKLSALKSFLLALKRYFPGTPNAQRLIAKLSDWINNHRGNVTGARFASKLEQLTVPWVVMYAIQSVSNARSEFRPLSGLISGTNSNTYRYKSHLKTSADYLPEMRPWIACKGSSPKYRGYPCSLWTLFHTLTVQAYEDYQDNPRMIQETPQKILYDIRGYVKYFFSCRVCSEHFQQMSANLYMEAKYPRDTVLWLWQAHNKVNRRLSGDATEDPKHKKVQFPTAEACAKCRLGPKTGDGSIPWEKSAVLRYLRHFYQKERIRNHTTEYGYADSPSFNVEDNSLNDGGRQHSQVLFHLLNVIPLVRYVHRL